MTARTDVVGVLALALLAGCAGGTGPAPSANGPLLLSSEGFLAGPTGLEIGFGRAPEGAIAAISELTGSPPIARDQGRACGDRDTIVESFPDGLAVTFRERMFSGWDYTGPEGAFATRDGLTTGLPADALGLEMTDTGGARTFTSGGIEGRVGADGQITRLWAGVPCPAP